MLSVEFNNTQLVELVDAEHLSTNSLYVIAVAPVTAFIGRVVIRVGDGIYELNDWSDCWSIKNCIMKFREFKLGEMVTLTQV